MDQQAQRTLSFDDILSNNIGFGKFQLQNLLVTGLIDFMDGAEFMFLQLLNSVLYKEWSLSLGELIILSAIFNAGLFLGSLLSGIFADALGRKTVLMFGSLIQFAAILLTAFVQNLPQLLFLRLLLGCLYGLMLPLSQILVTELTPMKMRGRFIVALQMNFILGRMWTVMLAGFFLVSLSEGNWRAIALCNCIPCFLCFLGTYSLLKESPRYLICQGRIEEGVAGINEMGHVNDDNYIDLHSDDVDALREWQQETFQEAMARKKTLKDLFNKTNLPITWRSYCAIVLLMGIYYGIILLLPFLLDKEEKTILDLFYTVIAEVPAVVVVYFLIESWGRLPFALTGTACTALAMLVIAVWQSRFLMTGLLGFKFFIRMTFLAIIPLIVESYSTIYRTMGIGSTLGLGKIAGALAPLIMFPIYDYDHYMPFSVGMVSLLLIGLIALSYPKEMTNQQLDGKTEKLE